MDTHVEAEERPSLHGHLVVCFSGQTPEVGPAVDHEGCYGPHHEVGPEVL